MLRTGMATVLAAIVLTAFPAAAKPKPADSWGKPGVSFETYRNDALECALTGYYADVSETDQAQKFVRATTRLQTNDDHSMGMALASPQEEMYRMVQIAARSEQIRASIRPEKLMHELQQGMVGLVQGCLIDRGYSQFRLTEDQREQLRGLKKGSDERRHFLHALASDPMVLEDQALPASG